MHPMVDSKAGLLRYPVSIANVPCHISSICRVAEFAPKQCICSCPKDSRRLPRGIQVIESLERSRQEYIGFVQVDRSGGCVSLRR
jgi:hypothetical protein